ncbi:MAG: DUF3854 domain-containing protein [Eubacteriales bacterium]|nr:DUF3854 domain-containing protein [Eubacteriales bacterium]
MNNKSKRAEVLEQMFDQVHRVPIESWLSNHGFQLTRKGQYLYMLCPFHPDSRLGSFLVHPSDERTKRANSWHCFTDNIGGNLVSFVSRYNGVRYLDAAFEIAVEYHIITAEERESLFRKRWDQSVIKKIQQREEDRTKVVVERADEDVIRAVYQALPKVCGLSRAHKTHLLERRKLGPADLTDFFTFPTRRKDLVHEILLYLQVSTTPEFLARAESQLAIVPGFFRDDKKGKIDFLSYKGFGFVLRDENGNPVGIQVRLDEKKDDSRRYVWFSSSFAAWQEGLSGGSPSGAPGGYIPSKTSSNQSPKLCITEGRFKAEALSRQGFDAVYVSGVSAYQNVLKMIERIQSGRTVFLFFDSDMMGNPAVHKQLEALHQELEKRKYPHKVVCWRKELGKGIDDAFANPELDPKHQVVAFSYDTFDKVYQEAYQEVQKEHSYQDGDIFTNALQKSVEEKLHL